MLFFQLCSSFFVLCPLSQLSFGVRKVYIVPKVQHVSILMLCGNNWDAVINYDQVGGCNLRPCQIQPILLGLHQEFTDFPEHGEDLSLFEEGFLLSVPKDHEVQF